MNNVCKIVTATLVILAYSAQGQLTVDTNITPLSMVEDVLVGNCVGISNVTYNGSATPSASSIERGTFTSTGTNLGLTNGIILSSGSAVNASGSEPGINSTATGNGSDADLELLSGFTINDVSILEFDFVPNGDSVSFRYVFASEEYPDYVCGTFNDAFGFFLSGPGISGNYSNNAINIALIPNSTIPISINTVNSGTPGFSGPANCEMADPNWQNNSVYFVDNANGTQISYGGFTTVLTAQAAVQCNETYHIKLAIGDGGDFDYIFDSSVFLEAGSFSSVPFVPTLSASPSIIGNTIYESCLPLQFDFLRTSCDQTVTETVNVMYSGSAVNGTDIVPALPTQLVFGPGESMITVPFTAPVDADGPEDLILTLQTLDCNGEIATNVFAFMIEALPQLQLSPDMVTIACGESAILAPVATGGFGQYTYLWSTGATTPSITVSPTETTTYDLTVTDLCSITVTGSYQVSIAPAPPLVMNIIGDSDLTEGCEVGTVNVIRPSGTDGAITIQLAGTGTATNASDYTLVTSWVIPEGVLNNQFTVPVNDDALIEGNETIVVTGSYTNACAQTVPASVTFTIIDAEPLLISTNDIQAECSGDTALIQASVTGGSAPYGFVWSTAQTDNAIYVPLSVDATYNVTVTDDCGRVANDVAYVTIDCEVIIPNVFSPNNDGSNDRWVIDGLSSKGNTVRVFNRWGNKVLDVENYSNNWAATDVPDGIYFYEVLVRNKPEPYTGHLTIVRKY